MKTCRNRPSVFLNYKNGKFIESHFHFPKLEKSFIHKFWAYLFYVVQNIGIVELSFMKMVRIEETNTSFQNDIKLSFLYIKPIEVRNECLATTSSNSKSKKARDAPTLLFNILRPCLFINNSAVELI